MRDGLVDIGLSGGGRLQADTAVLAPGIFAPGTAWAPRALRDSARFVADPWAPGALDAVPADGDVLLVGTGLTAVDVALTLEQAGRTLHMVSRRGRLPAVHTSGGCEPPAPPSRRLAAAAGGLPVGLDGLRELVAETVLTAVRDQGDWRPAFDTLRPLTGALWSELDDDDRATFLRQDAAWWDLHRHRMAPPSAAALHELRADGRLAVGADEVVDVEEAADALVVRLGSGRTMRFAAVVNCTGPLGDVRAAGDPCWTTSCRRARRPSGRSASGWLPTTGGWSTSVAARRLRCGRSGRCAAASSGSRRRSPRSVPRRWRSPRQ